MPRLDITITSHSPNDLHYVHTEHLDKVSIFVKGTVYSHYVGYYHRKTDKVEGSIAIAYLYKVSPEVRSYIDAYISTNPELFI